MCLYREIFADNVVYYIAVMEPATFVRFVRATPHGYPATYKTVFTLTQTLDANNICTALQYWYLHLTSQYHSGYGLSQWETMCYCNVVSHWLSTLAEWTLPHAINKKGAVLISHKTHYRHSSRKSESTRLVFKLLNVNNFSHATRQRCQISQFDKYFNIPSCGFDHFIDI